MGESIDYLKGYYIGKRDVYNQLEKIVEASRQDEDHIYIQVFWRNFLKFFEKELVSQLNESLDQVTAALIQTNDPNEIIKFTKEL